MGITARDIAKELGVSPSAVSLAMNGKPGVSEETREKILSHATKMGYSFQRKDVSVAARNIRYVIFLENGATVKETSFYSIVERGIESKAKEYGYNVFVSYFYASGDWTEQINAAYKDVSGIVILATEMESQHFEKAYAHGFNNKSVPIVFVDNATSKMNVDCVVCDSLRGAYTAVNYLFDKGHPDVGYLRSKNRIDNFSERQNGVLKARKERGISPEKQLQVVDIGVSSELAYEDMCDWLEKGGKPMSAYFADNDIIAAACIRALKAKGYRMPEDVSIVGFDDMPICTMVDPTITTIRIMKSQLGITAMEILRQRMEDKDLSLKNPKSGVYRTIISTPLIERESVTEYHKK